MGTLHLSVAKDAGHRHWITVEGDGIAVPFVHTGIGTVYISSHDGPGLPDRPATARLWKRSCAGLVGSALGAMPATPTAGSAGSLPIRPGSVVLVCSCHCHSRARCRLTNGILAHIAPRPSGLAAPKAATARSAKASMTCSSTKGLDDAVSTPAAVCCAGG